MSDRIVKNVNIKSDKCGRDIKFNVHYDYNGKDKYIKSRLDDVEVCSCSGSYKQYSDEYQNMVDEIEE